MAFSGSSYVAGIGTAFAAIVFGFACGTMITTRAVQPPNRLERVNAGATDPAKPESSSTASSSTEQSSPTRSSAQETPTVAVAPSAAIADPQPAPPPQPAALAVVKTDAATNVGEKSAPAPVAKNAPPSPVIKSADTTPAKNERAGTRSADADKEVSHKRADERRFSDNRRSSERRRRHDQQERQLDETTNVVRQTPQLPPESTVGTAVEREDDTPRYRMRPRPFGLSGDDDSPRVINEPPPRFGFFGD
jgi:hypothetical protein